MVLGQIIDAVNNLTGDDMRNILFALALAAVALMVAKQMMNSEGLDDDVSLDSEMAELDESIQKQMAAESAAANANGNPAGVASGANGVDISGVIRDERHLPQFPDSSLDAEELLPEEHDDRFLKLHPRGGANKLNGRNFLSSKPHFGVDTQGSTLKNANRQLRSEPANPVVSNLTPFNNSSIDPADDMRRPMEIGSAASVSVEPLPAFV